MKRLLLVDDDRNFRHMLSRALTKRGFVVAAAAGVSDVETHMRKATPHYAVVDMKLEETSGLELIAPLRAANQAMRIVMLTGYASIATTVEAIKRGADDYLAKPLDLKALLAALEDPQLAEGNTEPIAPMSLRRLEWEYIQRILDEHNGNISAAARALGLHRRTLQRRLAKRPVQR